MGYGVHHKTRFDTVKARTNQPLVCRNKASLSQMMVRNQLYVFQRMHGEYQQFWQECKHPHHPDVDIKKKIKSLDELEDFIQTKSAWVSQVTLYGYLKTRMGTRYVLHFENDEFMKSVNLAKWNIYAVALQDLTFFTFSYLKATTNYEDSNRAK